MRACCHSELTRKESAMARELFFAAMVMCAVAPVGFAQSQAHDWELSFAFTGTSDRDFNDHVVGFSGGLGYYPFANFELSIRQTLAYSSIGDSSATIGSTQGAVDYYFPLGDRQQWQPFIGANVAYLYGDVVSDHFEAGPEGGSKYYVNTTTFIYVRGEYQIFFGGN